MTDVGDRLRLFAEECDNVSELTGVIFVKSGDLEIHLACADPRTPARETMRLLLIAASNAALNGTMKAATGEELSEIEKILASP